MAKTNFYSLRMAILAAVFFTETGADSQTSIDAEIRSVDLPVNYVTVNHPVWSRNAVIYEINTRQFTEEGTLNSAEKRLSKLKDMGVTIIWLMPIFPIGIENRLGSAGSPYSVRDYLSVNPELGNMDDLRNFVESAHKKGMYVILDWVANHSARDNILTISHPDWYEHDETGQLRPPLWTGWTDVVDFNYQSPQLRRYMTEALKFWVREAGVDGFRADFAGGVPLQFWENARAELDEIKPVFMLAEWDFPDLNRRAFDASYAWKLTEAMRGIAAGKADVRALDSYFNWQSNAWPREAFKLAFTSNHDVNQWGTDREIFGAALSAMVALTFTADVMPLIYNGEEAGNEKRLNFLTREAINWRASPSEALYTKLIAWKKANPALHNGQYGGPMIPVKNDVPMKVFSFVREKGPNKILAVFNFSDQPQNVKLGGTSALGRYIDFADGEVMKLSSGTIIQLPAWGFRLLATDRAGHLEKLVTPDGLK